MNTSIGKKYKFPRIGMRIIKSAIGVLMCFVIYFIRGKQGTPFYSALAVLWCIQSQSKDTLNNAIQRTIGTSIGAIYGLIYILFKQNFINFEDSFGHYFMISVLIIPILYTTVVLKQKKASYFSCVVFLSIVVNHLSDKNPYIFVLNRGFDTLIGIFLGLIINSIHIHGKLDKKSLYVVNIDDLLNRKEEKLSPYSSVTIKNMLEDGINMTFSSLYTPATILENLPGIKPKIPVITMDGAVLYDISENRYPKIYAISSGNAGKIENFITDKGFNVFTTVILEDVLLIYYKDLKNDAEKDIYDKLHRSPYRNYLNKERVADHLVVYMMCIDTTERIGKLLRELKSLDISKDLKFLFYPSKDYVGYSYLKIYNKNASVSNMIDYLKENTDLGNTIMLSDNKRNKADYYYDESNKMIRKLYKMFYFCKM